MRRRQTRALAGLETALRNWASARSWRGSRRGQRGKLAEPRGPTGRIGGSGTVCEWLSDADSGSLMGYLLDSRPRLSCAEITSSCCWLRALCFNGLGFYFFDYYICLSGIITPFAPSLYPSNRYNLVVMTILQAPH